MNNATRRKLRDYLERAKRAIELPGKLTKPAHATLLSDLQKALESDDLKDDPSELKTPDAELIARMLFELLDGHIDKCEEDDLPSLTAEGYASDSLQWVDYAGLCNGWFSVATGSGVKFVITVEQRERMIDPTDQEG